VRTCQKPDASLPPLQSTDLIGGNQGNLLYQFSTVRALATEGVDLRTISYRQFDKGAVEERAEWLNSECDHLVLPLSSSFRLQMLKNLQLWADLIERLTIPVTVVGIGAQLRLADVEAENYVPSRVTGITASADQIEEHEAASRRFVAAVLDRSTSIGVRGEVSKRYLQHLGFPADRIDVIGCPSVFMWGPDFRMPEQSPRLTPRSTMSLSFDHRINATADLLEQTVRDFPRATIYMQERLGAQMVITGKETRPDWNGDLRFPVHVDHPLFRSHRLEYYPTAWSWIRHLKGMDFAYGPRLHGTVAATLAGTSAHLLVHDSRTLEIAQHHHLPYTLIERLGEVGSAHDLAARQDYTAFNAAYPELFARFTAFLGRNGLANAYEGENPALTAFDASTEHAANARGVLSNTRPRPTLRQVLGKVRRSLGLGRR
jgi:hypothetical protein